MVVSALVTFTFSLRHYRHHPAFRIIPYYLGSFLFATAVDFNEYLSPRDRLADFFDNIGLTVLTIFEFCVFSLLILHYITGAGRRLAIKLNAVMFFLVEIFLYFRAFPRPTLQMSMLESIALVLPCVVYFYELFNTVNTKALKDRPSFWIAIGIGYVSVCSLTETLSFEYIGRFGDGAYALGDIFYSILFVLFMRAYKCSPEEPAAA